MSFPLTTINIRLCVVFDRKYPGSGKIGAESPGYVSSGSGGLIRLGVRVHVPDIAILAENRVDGKLHGTYMFPAPPQRSPLGWLNMSVDEATAMLERDHGKVVFHKEP